MPENAGLIVVGVDGTPAALQAARWSSTLPTPNSSSLDVMGEVDSPG